MTSIFLFCYNSIHTLLRVCIVEKQSRHAMTSLTEYIPSRYQRDRELFESYWSWHLDRYGTEPTTQQSLLCCDWALHLLENSPTNE